MPVVVPNIWEQICKGRLHLHSAPGPDGMTCELLTNCTSVISESLAALFTKSLTEGSVPTLLKRAAVVPIYNGHSQVTTDLFH